MVVMGSGDLDELRNRKAHATQGNDFLLCG
jgi:hypothetical protein